MPCRSLPGLLLSTLSASFFLLGAAVSGNVQAATITVANCNDTGPGSLRAAVAAAASGDVVDLRSLACSRIVFGTGSVYFGQDDLTFKGPGRDRLVLDGNWHGNRAIEHWGRGTLRIEDLSIENSRDEVGFSQDMGGCIKSLGHVEVVRSRVHHCLLVVRDDVYWTEEGRGGGIYAAGNVLIDRSAVSDAHVITFGYGGAVNAGGTVTILDSEIRDSSAYYGGGIAANGLTLRRSVVSGNRARVGGGLHVDGAALIEDTTISGNVASEPQHPARDEALAAGGLSAYSGPIIINSTLSGNSAEYWAAMLIQGEDARILNSTIAFNRNTLDCRGAIRSILELDLESTIAAGNTCAGAPAPDISVYIGGVVGSHNLIGLSSAPLPADTISADPLLAPLADNGGPSPTHLLRRGSPAIGRGSNLLDLRYDQRGRPFARIRGGAPDIGATESRFRTE
ncbi:choice-of-anchor Q domain-containing protein [Pseudoxanthomonas beigongshangi]